MALLPFAEFVLDQAFELFVELLLFGVTLGELLVEDAEVADVEVQINLHKAYYNFNRNCIELLG